MSVIKPSALKLTLEISEESKENEMLNFNFTWEAVELGSKYLKI